VSIKNLSENHEFSILNKMVIKGGRCVPGSNIINSPPGKSVRKEESGRMGSKKTAAGAR
jgi:hypothetical protein